MNTVTLETTLVCPACGHNAPETMPTDACQYFYECGGCGALLRPEAGDCCVYCIARSLVQQWCGNHKKSLESPMGPLEA